MRIAQKYKENVMENITALLHNKYGKSVLSKTETANELGVSISTMTNRMRKGINIPNYIKEDGAANTSVVFPIKDVAEYLSRTVKVL